MWYKWFFNKRTVEELEKEVENWEIDLNNLESHIKSVEDLIEQKKKEIDDVFGSLEKMKSFEKWFNKRKNPSADDYCKRDLIIEWENLNKELEVAKKLLKKYKK